MKSKRGDTAEENGTPSGKVQSQTYEEFVAEVKFVLQKSHGTPEKVAGELLQADSNYLRACWEKEQGEPGSISILDVAAEISLDPGSGESGG